MIQGSFGDTGKSPKNVNSDVYSPVVKYATVRAVFATAAARNLELRQGDVTAVFLGRDLDENEPVYIILPKEMEIPPDIVKNKGKHTIVVQVNKSLYGLKKSPMLWNEKVYKTMLLLGLKRSPYDTGLYYRDGI